MVDVYADGEYVMSVTEDTAFEAGLKIGKELDVDTLGQIEKSSLLVKAKAKGWQLVLVDGYPLGWGKLANGTLKNKYLPGWRWQS